MKEGNGSCVKDKVTGTNIQPESGVATGEAFKSSDLK